MDRKGKVLLIAGRTERVAARDSAPDAVALVRSKGKRLTVREAHRGVGDSCRRRSKLEGQMRMLAGTWVALKMMRLCFWGHSTEHTRAEGRTGTAYHRVGSMSRARVAVARPTFWLESEWVCAQQLNNKC